MSCWSSPRVTIFLSTLSLRRATRGWTLNINGPIFLSTLSLRRATVKFSVSGSVISISIHTLLAESDYSACSKKIGRLLFLSTLSLRRATLPVSAFTDYAAYFYPHSPCGERRINRDITHRKRQFLSTLSLRRATHYDNYNLHCVEISIHTLLAESDLDNKTIQRAE